MASNKHVLSSALCKRLLLVFFVFFCILKAEDLDADESARADGALRFLSLRIPQSHSSVLQLFTNQCVALL